MKRLLNSNILFIIGLTFGLLSCQKITVGYFPYEYILDDISSCEVYKINNGYLELQNIFYSNATYDSVCINLEFSFKNVSKHPYHGALKNFLSKIIDIKVFINDTINVDSLFYYGYLQYPTGEELVHELGNYKLSKYYYIKETFLNNYPENTYNHILLILKNRNYFNQTSQTFKIEVTWAPYKSELSVKRKSIYTGYVVFQ